MKIKLTHSFEDIISLENLCLAWGEFIAGKKNKQDIQFFSKNLSDNIFSLHEDLKMGTYKHDSYQSFFITDPKLRHIHKASVRDRLLHHALYRILYPFFDKIFISDTFSCRNGKGTHKALDRFRSLAYKVSKNHTKTCWVLKGDIKKCFASVNQDVLLRILTHSISDDNILWLLAKVINSFSVKEKTGIPLGNLTSQLFINIYMNELDQFMKHSLKARYYIRYADDFVILSYDKSWLESLIPCMSEFLTKQLYLTLHPKKLFIKTFASGVDFLGWVHFPYHRILRTTTRHRMMKRLKKHPKDNTLQSYLGLLSHGNTFELRQDLLQKYWVRRI